MACHGKHPIPGCHRRRPIRLPNAAWVNDPATVSDKRLDSPPVTIPFLQNADSYVPPQLRTFRTALTAACWRSASTAAPSRTPAWLHSSRRLQRHDQHMLRQSAGRSPGVDRQFWWIYHDSSGRCPQGHTIALRWRMGSDNSGSGQGWRIDTVQIICERAYADIDSDS